MLYGMLQEHVCFNFDTVAKKMYLWSKVETDRKLLNNFTKQKKKEQTSWTFVGSS